MDNFYNLLPLIISLVLNALQLIQAICKQRQEHELNLKRLGFERDNKEKDREHSLKLKKLEHKFKFDRVEQDNLIYIQRDLLPKLQELAFKYISVTRHEIYTHSLPVRFSENQQNLEMAISVYCPEMQEPIKTFHQVNNDRRTFRSDLLEVMDDEIIPTLSRILEPHPTKYKEETLQK